MFSQLYSFFPILSCSSLALPLPSSVILRNHFHYLSLSSLKFTSPFHPQPFNSNAPQPTTLCKRFFSYLSQRFFNHIFSNVFHATFFPNVSPPTSSNVSFTIFSKRFSYYFFQTFLLLFLKTILLPPFPNVYHANFSKRFSHHCFRTILSLSFLNISVIPYFFQHSVLPFSNISLVISS